jgi:hypothetical protein
MANHQEQVISLAEARNILQNFISPNISLVNIRQSNPNLDNVGLTAHDLFLQIRIIFHSQNDVDHYLENYLTAHGPNRLGELMNRGIPVPNTNFRITPLDCATLWSANDRMVQLLYEWGSNASFTSIQRSREMNMEFGNHFGMIRYFNHLQHFRLNGYDNYNYPPLNSLRNVEEFHDTINQRIWQASEQNLFFPGRRVINILNRRRRHQANQANQANQDNNHQDEYYRNNRNFNNDNNNNYYNR